MKRSLSQAVRLGPGGSIPDIPENQELLNLIEKTPALSPQQLIVLANFYHVYQTNTFLADHLALVGETKLLSPPIIKDLGDYFEDLFTGYDEADDNQEKAIRSATFRVYRGDAPQGPLDLQYPLTYANYEIKCVPELVPGLGLLVETYLGRDPHVIGVCPGQEQPV